MSLFRGFLKEASERGLGVRFAAGNERAGRLYDLLGIPRIKQLPGTDPQYELDLDQVDKLVADIRALSRVGRSFEETEYAWDPRLHPRDPRGRFMPKAAFEQSLIESANQLDLALGVDTTDNSPIERARTLTRLVEPHAPARHRAWAADFLERTEAFLDPEEFAHHAKMFSELAKWVLDNIEVLATILQASLAGVAYAWNPRLHPRDPAGRWTHRSWAGFPLDLRTGERPREEILTKWGTVSRPGDIPPERTPEGHFILYHGTSRAGADAIRGGDRIRPDDIGSVGVTTVPGQAQTFASMKGRRGTSEAVVLRLVLDKDWLAQQRVTHEIGGSGHDQFLIDHPHGVRRRDWHGIPPEAILGIEEWDFERRGFGFDPNQPRDRYGRWTETGARVIAPWKEIIGKKLSFAASEVTMANMSEDEQKKVRDTWERQTGVPAAKVTANVRDVFRAAEGSPEWEEGLTWYEDAHEFARQRAETHDLPIETTAGVLSALSPMTEWNWNKRQADYMVQAYSRDPEHFNSLLPQQAAHEAREWAVGRGEKWPLGAGRRNMVNAARLIQGESPETVLPQAKTRGFYNSIVEPNNPWDVVVDTHMINVAYGGMTPGVAALLVEVDKPPSAEVWGDPVTPEGAEYTARKTFSWFGSPKVRGRDVGVAPLIADSVREVAGEWNAEHPEQPLSPMQVQAIVWTQWLKMHPAQEKRAAVKASQRATIAALREALA